MLTLKLVLYVGSITSEEIRQIVAFQEVGVKMEHYYETPNSVKGPDGQTLTLADLPSPSIKRWVTRRKAEVVAAVKGGLLSREDACERYSLSAEEFEAWEKLYARHGMKGLRTTRLQTYRR